ncbi:MAG TPA: delta-60 repeat domain-containing protein [Solirubrobacterales bacterium]|nr:delta-60 repeat domain-containing protein [Solirubrobacterales bacterium]
MNRKLILVLALAIAAALPAKALGAGDLEYEFGEGGKVITPVPLHQPWSRTHVQLAGAPDGAMLVAGDERVLRYAPGGQLDASFGRGGVLQIALPGVAGFEIADLEVDSEGRIILIGTAVVGALRGSGGTSAAILRYLPDGEPDTSFGGDGLVIAHLGLRGAGGVTASQGAIDGQNRIILVAGTAQRTSSCGSAPRLAYRDRLIARFTPSGTLDPSFGRHGTQTIEPLQKVSAMSLDGSGVVLAGKPLGACGGPETGVIRLRPDGSQVLDFGRRGTRTLTGSVAAIAVDRRERVVFLFKEKQKVRPLDEHVTKLVRLLPDGRRDPSFAGNGLVVYEFQGPLYKWTSLLIDPEGRLLAVGTLVRPLPKKKQRGGLLYHRWLMVWPLQESGAQQGGFGWLGWLSITRFNSRSDAAASEAVIDEDGELLVAGTTREPHRAPHGGFALARFELWH